MWGHGQPLLLCRFQCLDLNVSAASNILYMGVDIWRMDESNAFLHDGQQMLSRTSKALSESKALSFWRPLTHVPQLAEIG